MTTGDASTRRTSTIWARALVGVFCLATMAACTPEPGPTTPAAVGSTTPAPTAPTVAPPTGVATSVLRVVDGDTFVTADGVDVRVLGIDSCEAATPGGRRATAAARGLLVGAAVTLSSEPGVDRDRYGRALRYVTANGRDYSEAMVVADHTAIYAKSGNDASPARQATLRRLDAGGRSCGDPAPAARPARPGPVADVDRPSTRRPAVAAPARPARPAAAPARPRATRAPSAPAAPTASGGYANCAAAKAAGVAPLRAGQAGYSRKLDRDGDGVACE